MNRSAIALCAFVLSLGACQAPENTRGNVNVLGGMRWFDDSSFDSVDSQPTFGVDGAVYLGEGGFAVEGGWLRSEDDDTDTITSTKFEVTVDEYFGGLRYTLLKDELIEPYIGAGATWIDVAADAGGSSADDDAIALYARVGAAVNLGALRLGLDGRGVFFSDLDFPGGGSGDADYLQLMAFAGLRF
jgi:hypothetical protein